MSKQTEYVNDLGFKIILYGYMCAIFGGFEIGCGLYVLFIDIELALAILVIPTLFMLLYSLIMFAHNLDLWIDATKKPQPRRQPTDGVNKGKPGLREPNQLPIKVTQHSGPPNSTTKRGW